MNNPFNFFDSIVYINLDHREDRKNSILQEFDKYYIKALRIPGIVLSEEENKKFTDKGYPLCEPVSDNDLEHKERIQKVTLHQRSCGMSHLAAIELAKKNNFSNILVFEDDVMFNDKVNVFQILTQAIAELKNIEWDLFFIGCIPLAQTQKQSPNLAKLSHLSATHAYVINKSCYDTILDFPFQELPNIDQYFSRLSYNGKVKAFTTVSPLAFQKEDHSDIQGRLVGSIQKVTEERYTLFI